MRKSFEKNVPRRRPRLKRAAAPEAPAPGALQAKQPVATSSRAAAPAPRVELEKIRRTIVRPAPSIQPARAVPARPPEHVPSPVEALRAELARAREREEALRGELHAARGELARATEARGAADLLARAAGETRGAADRLARATGETRGAADRLAAAYADYLRQAMARRAQLAQASGQDGPTRAPGAPWGGAAERDAAQPELAERIQQAASAAAAGSDRPPLRVVRP